jgi:hypothetical protein
VSGPSLSWDASCSRALLKLTLHRRAGTVSTPTGTNTATATVTGQDRMASDEDYMAFLDKANQDPSIGYSAMGQKIGGKVQLKTMDEGATVPDELRMATEREEWIYVSDADEPFVAVSLKLSGHKLPDEGLFPSYDSSKHRYNRRILTLKIY